ncbi:hypothetical protein [Sulfuricurvum sp.]|uniref:hypothetical protein n=1 Tax=Sulfuricurvum sp. TaxID=2025608 RepID=UPI00260220C6|nr:hypothetical protein [Sulfuricurvum sp.]MDD2267640.1 hypothetical protein [Sulfuricurvum sp.]MDD2784968.1 hypothetical protein [Sulfuricurvum sp.]
MAQKMDISSAKQNEHNMKFVLDKYNLGPIKTSINPKDNKAYWDKIAQFWKVSPEAARCRLCANCEYYDNTESMMLQMDTIPLNKYDMDGGGRGYCCKFDFICHNLRTCSAQEPKKYVKPKDAEVIPPQYKEGNMLKLKLGVD